MSAVVDNGICGSTSRLYRNAHAVSTLMRLLLIDGRGYFTVVLTRGLLAGR